MSDAIGRAIRAAQEREEAAEILTAAFAEPPHRHVWERAYVMERMTGEQTGDPRVYRCLACDQTEEYVPCAPPPR